MPMKNSCLILLLLTGLGFILGCGVTGNTDTAAIEYRFISETRKRSLDFRATLKPGDVANVSLSKGYGIIDWMMDEGKKVASGEMILKIDMESFETRYRNSEIAIEGQLDVFDKVRFANPAEIADLKLNLRTRELELERALFERKWLFKPKTADEIWKIKADLAMAKVNFNLASELYQLKKNITDKGFDSAFALRSSEIEQKSREIELDYAQRLLEQLQKPPLPEELAQIDFQKAVASGEIWLAENRLVSASISAKIREKSLEVILERYRSNSREYKKTLDESEKFAPRDGIVIHPVLWGDFKFRVGQQAWQGVSIMQVIVDGKYYLEALLNENQVNGLKEKASASISIDSCSQKIFAGEIKSIGKAPKSMRGARNSALKFIPVEISLNASESLVFGSQADVKVDLGAVTGVFVPRDLIEKKNDQNLLTLKNSFSSEKVVAELEDFDQDWVLWKNPPSPQGVLLYP